jgi:ribonucleotide reductase alpha subunit
MRVCQEHIDQAISITLHVDTEKYSIADVIKMQIYSHNIGLKSLYYIRTIFKKLMGEETIIQTNNVDTCESCMV